MSVCPICKKEAAPRGGNAAFPFCSARCKQVDLGKWLDEEYRVATIDAPGDEDGESKAAPGRLTETE